MGTHPCPTAMAVTCSSRTDCPDENIHAVKISLRLNLPKCTCPFPHTSALWLKNSVVLPTFKHLRFLEVAVERDIKLTLRSVAFLHLTGRHPGLGAEGAKERGTVHAMYCCPCLSANLVTDLAVGEFSNFGGQMFLLRSSNCHSLSAGISLANITEH